MFSKILKNEVLSGVTVALALIPESVAFAFVAGVSPILSLKGAVVMGLVAAIFTGRPAMISSSTAAISVVFASLIATHGLEYLFATVILMGIIQILLGVFKLGKYTQIIPYSVTLGFLNGLSIVMFLAQFSQFKINGNWLPTKDLLIMIIFVLVTMAIIHFTSKITSAIPSSLVAIVSVTIISSLMSHYDIYSLRTVQDFAGMELKGDLPKFYIPHVSFSLETFKIIFPYAVTGGLVGLTEAVLTGRVIDEMTNTKSKINKEFFAQGLGNLVNGLFGGMGGDAMIGQSIINVKSGGRTRFSAIIASVTLMIFMLFGSAFTNAIPLSGLVGVMFMVVVGTFKWESLKYGGKIPRSDVIVVLAVTFITIFQDLATAVIVGVILSALMFAWEKGKIIYANIETGENGEKIYKINGVLFFGSVYKLKEIFDVNKDPVDVILDLKYAKVMDFSGIETINAIAERYEALGKTFTLIRPNENCRMLLQNAKNIGSIKFAIDSL
ncbi:SulP family inorganic anion transporter [Psychrilyobacter atlanticus]|uniref:SulP family inorganic anion transporter n=1 Tax=Psychrilyobacter atlanticus TaxID=271091 RepID=UPI0003FA5753|nr:SulP family inorganic anion transporter [Psychrilyobacter atlanticus]